MVDNNLGDHSQRYSYNTNYNPTGSGTSDQDGVIMVKEQDRLLPIANVGRIMKQILPPNAKISKEAKETMQECVSEFISFATGEASEKCHKEKRKTVNGDDICWALGTLGFDDYAEPLRRYLNRYRELEGERSAHRPGPTALDETRPEVSHFGSGQPFEVSRDDRPGVDEASDNRSFSRRF